jgi:hypothetical protein
MCLDGAQQQKHGAHTPRQEKPQRRRGQGGGMIDEILDQLMAVLIVLVFVALIGFAGWITEPVGAIHESPAGAIAR